MEQEFASTLLDAAVNEFAKLPGIGRKTALRLVLHILRQDVQQAHLLGEAIIKLREEVKYCRVCHNISEHDVCEVCSNPMRDHSVICVVVASVILGGITRISRIATKIVPTMVGLYFLLVAAIIIIHADKVPGVFASILDGAFSLDAGIGGLIGTAIIGFRRAAYVNEAGVGTTSLMHGASRNDNPIREGLVTMIGPSIDSGLVCTLTAIPIIIAGNYVGSGEIKGLYIALNSFDALLPGYGHYLLMVIVLFFAFSTMFSYSYYGLKCTNFLFGAHRAKYYNYFYLVMIIVAAVIPLGSVVALMDLSFALMALPNMTAAILLAPRVKRLANLYFADEAQDKGK